MHLPDTQGSALDTSGTVGGSAFSFTSCVQVPTAAPSAAPTTTLATGPATHSVDNMNGLFNKVSSDTTSAANTGDALMTNGDKVFAAVGTYKCSDGTCAGGAVMLNINPTYGDVECAEDDASCIIDAEEARKAVQVLGTEGEALSFRAFTIKDAKSQYGSGLTANSGTVVVLKLCAFINCQATHATYGGAAILAMGTVDTYGTSFSGSTAASGNGNDIMLVGGAMTVHNTCPSPYSSTSPVQGKFEMARRQRRSRLKKLTICYLI